MTRAALLFLLLCACSALRVPKPDLRIGERVSVYYAGQQSYPPELVAREVEVIRRRGRLLCAGREDQFDRAWCASITFRPLPFRCETGNTSDYSGCQPYPMQCSFEIGWRPSLAETALADEIGHYIWMTCFGRSGETEGSQYDLDFAIWVQDTREELRGIEVR